MLSVVRSLTPRGSVSGPLTVVSVTHPARFKCACACGSSTMPCLNNSHGNGAVRAIRNAHHDDDAQHTPVQQTTRPVQHATRPGAKYDAVQRAACNSRPCRACGTYRTHSLQPGIGRYRSNGTSLTVRSDSDPVTVSATLCRRPVTAGLGQRARSRWPVPGPLRCNLWPNDSKPGGSLAHKLVNTVTSVTLPSTRSLWGIHTGCRHHRRGRQLDGRVPVRST